MEKATETKLRVVERVFANSQCASSLPTPRLKVKHVRQSMPCPSVLIHLGNSESLGPRCTEELFCNMSNQNYCQVQNEPRFVKIFTNRKIPERIQQSSSKENNVVTIATQESLANPSQNFYSCSLFSLRYAFRLASDILSVSKPAPHTMKRNLKIHAYTGQGQQEFKSELNYLGT